MCDKASGARNVCRLVLGLCAAATLVSGFAWAAPAPAKVGKPPPLPAAPAPAASPALTDDAASDPTIATSRPASASGPESCRDCHAAFERRKYKHAALARTDCLDCHKATKRVGRCKSATASAWVLTKAEGELCAKCHDEKKISARFTVKHETGGRCSPCHDAHASEQPKLMKVAGRQLCLPCHDSRSPKSREVRLRIDTTKKVTHKSFEGDCAGCHQVGHGGSARNLLKRKQPDLCYECHKRMDRQQVTHTAIRQGECLECHDPHTSEWKGLTKKAPEQVCLACHELEPLAPKEVKHAPVTEGRCLDCHDAHGGERTAFVKGTGKAQCMKCHDVKSPTGKGEASAAMRLDLEKKVVHAAVKKGECSDCHVTGHSADHPKMLRKQPVALCNGCHTRKDDQKFPHSAVVVGDCTGCHDAHSSDTAKLYRTPRQADACFRCHQDDLTGRKFIHAPVATGKCMDCHGPHGAQFRWILTIGKGKEACYACHEVVDRGTVRHAALERYGCTGCHDPHGTQNRFFLAQKTNALCISCHPKQPDGRHVASSGARSHVVDGLIDPRKPDRDFSCASCHNPHGSDNQKLFYFGNSSMEMCATCHGDKSGRSSQQNITYKAHKKKQQTGAGGGGAGGGSGGGGGGGGEQPSTKGESLNAAARKKYGFPK